MTATLHFELPSALVINANHREHWAPKAAKVRNLRAMGRIAAQGQKVGSDRAVLHIDIRWATRRAADAENLAPTIKALCDGAVGDAALLPDDSDAHVVERRWRGHYGGKRGITIIDLRFEPAEEDA